MKKVAISACLLGEVCRYDGTHNRDEHLLSLLKGDVLIPFCPEDFAFETPRPTMDLVDTPEGIRAISNESGEDLSEPILSYAQRFFESHPDIDLFIGKDRSPSCGVCSAKLYDRHKTLIDQSATGLMAHQAIAQGIQAIDAQSYTKEQ